MSPKLNKTRDVIDIAAYLALSAGFAAATLLIAQPWLLACGFAVASAVMVSAGLRLNKLQKNLEKYSGQSRIVQDLCKASGLPEKDVAIYTLKLDESKMRAHRGRFPKILVTMVEHMSQTYNVSVYKFKKTGIMISPPILSLLNDEEKKGVLAHEFVHAAANHNTIGVAQATLHYASKYTGIAAKAFAMFSTHWQGALGAIGGGMIMRKALHYIIPNGKLLDQKEENLHFRDVLKRIRAQRRRDIMAEAASAAIFTAVAPAYAAIWGIAKGISILSLLSKEALSRKKEYQADRGAVALGANPLALVTGFRKSEAIGKKSFEAAYEGPLPKPDFLRKAWARATASHPPTRKRIERLCDIAHKQGYSEEAIAEAKNGKIDVSTAHIIPPETLIFWTKIKQK